jgi:hypothetical protein
MIISDFILKLRRKYNDNPVKHEDVIQGDGSSTVYRTQFFPILEGSYRLYVGGVLKTESTDYDIDLDTGDIDLADATSAEIRIQYQEVKFRDQHWLEVIQDSFDSFGDQFFKSVIRSSSGIALVANQDVYDCPSSCIRLTEALESTTYLSAGPFRPLSTNVRYDRASNKMVLGQKPNRANYMEISYLRKLTRPVAVANTLDIDDKWLKLLDLKSGAEFLRSMANRYAQQGNATIEEGYLSVAQLRQLANDNEQMYENLKSNIRPVMPASTISYYINGAGIA